MDTEDIKSPLPSRPVNFAPTVPLEQLKENKAEGVSRVSTQAKPVRVEKKNSPVIIVLVILVAVVAVGIVLFKMFSGKTQKEKNVTLNYWGLWEESGAIEGVIADFETKNPNIKVVYKKNQKDDYRSRLQGRLQKSGEGGDVPDIFRLHASWIPMLEDDLAIVPTTTANKVQLESDFYEAYKGDLKKGNSFMGIPLMYDGLAMFYNKELIQAAQVEIPKSWWELETAAEKLTVRDESEKIKIAGAGLGLTENVDHWSDIVGLMLLQNGANPMIDDAANNKKIEDVLNFYTLFSSKSKVWSSSLPPSTQFFANGKLGFYFGPSWRVFNIEEINPKLKFEITTVPQLPVLTEGQTAESNVSNVLTDIHWATYWIEGVNKRSTKQNEAWKFLEFLASKETLEKMYTAASQIRSFGEIYPRKSMKSLMESNNMTKAFVTMADKSETWYLASRTFDAGLNDEMIRYFGIAIDSMLTQAAPTEDLMKVLRNGINQLGQKYQIKK